MWKITSDHEEIKRWTEKVGGKPAVIKRSPGVPSNPGLRIDFPGNIDEKLLGSSGKSKNVSWEEFFSYFDVSGLSFAYDENTEGNDPTEWYRFEIQKPE